MLNRNGMDIRPGIQRNFHAGDNPRGVAKRLGELARRVADAPARPS